MGARSTHNRYKTEPFGSDFKDVLKRAKAFFKDGTFYITKFNKTYCSERPSVWAKDPSDAVYFTKVNHKWIQQG